MKSSHEKIGERIRAERLRADLIGDKLRAPEEIQQRVAGKESKNLKETGSNIRFTTNALFTGIVCLYRKTARTYNFI